MFRIFVEILNDVYKFRLGDFSRIIINKSSFGDNVYNLTIQKTDSGIQILNSSHYYWPADSGVAEECRQKAASPEDCKNFVRILSIHQRSGDLLICGTHGYKPRCRLFDPKTRKTRREFSGTGLSPLDPRHNTTFYLDGDNLYSATVSDFSGSDSLIYRKNITEDSSTGIRTERNNIRLLNKPQFAGSLHTDKFIYFFFREKAIEVESIDGYGASGYYSRVARVCKNDKGGPAYYANEWTSFVKARLNCSLPGSKPFYFDQIVSISNATGGNRISGSSGGIVYATFVSEYEFLSHSVICAFNLNEIDLLFDKSDYLVSDPGNPAYYRKRRDPNSLTGKCTSDSKKLTPDQMVALKSTPLMADLVPNVFSRPVGIYESEDHYNQIAVLPNVHLPEHDHKVDILFVGTDQGNILKLVNLHGKNSDDKDPMVKVSVTKVGDSPIRRLIIFNEQYLIALTDRRVLAMPLQQCSQMSTCRACVEARDPHCGWHQQKRTCISIGRGDAAKHFIQDVFSGNSDSCREYERPEPQLVINAPKKESAFLSSNSTEPRSQGYRKFPNVDCDCAKNPRDSNCECSKRFPDLSEQAIKAEPEVHQSWYSSTYFLLALALLQLIIIVVLVYGICRYKKKQKKTVVKKDIGVIHAYGDPGHPVGQDLPQRMSAGYTIENYSPTNSIPQTQYEPFYPITQIQIDPGYQSGSLGSKSGSDIISRFDGSSMPGQFTTFSGGSSTASTSHPGTP
ncbi:hypothetical protein FO519_005030 [Halicephalobus sp. NKZ332]|nr:hypothetical protein FO519_005030 [Halicephalobus sp. NKZ332]